MNAPADIATLGEHRWDAVVIGAGPAGAVAAHDLARRGLSVLLVDRAQFPRYKVCGGCLNLRALHALSLSGLGACVWARGAAPLHEFALAASRRTAILPLPGGAAISRGALDLALAAAARRAGAVCVEGVNATVSAVLGEFVRVRLRTPGSDAQIEARACLVAAGLAAGAATDEIGVRARVARSARLGAGTLIQTATTDFVPGRIYMAVARGGYVGLVRVENDLLNVAGAFDTQFLRECGGPAAAARRILHTAGLPALQELDAAHWRGTPPLTRRARPLAQHRVILAGDAAGYVEPFTGEGIAWAVESGRAASARIHRALPAWDRSVAVEWETEYAQTFAAAQRRCKLVSWALRRPMIPATAVRTLRRLPMVARPLVRSLNSYTREEGSAPWPCWSEE